MNMKERILKTKDICELLQISPTTLWRWRKAGQFPEPSKITCSSYQGWREETVNQWVKTNFYNDNNKGE